MKKIENGIKELPVAEREALHTVSNQMSIKLRVQFL